MSLVRGGTGATRCLCIATMALLAWTLRLASLLMPLLAWAPLARAAMHPFNASLRDPGDGFNLTLLNATQYPNAVCLDGSRAGYYVRRPAAPSGVVIIELEGGGWCISDADCQGRSQGDLGSSRGWPSTGSPGMDGGSHGLFSNNCSINFLCNATMIHANYCDGGSFSGNVAAPVNISGNLIYYRGRPVLDAIISTLLSTEGVAAASLVVTKGCSAGGLSTILQVDHIASLIHAANASVKVVAVPDAGFFLDHNNTGGTPIYTPIYQWVAATQNVTPNLNAGCLAKYPPGEAWRCFMAQYAAPFLTTPTFFAQDLVSGGCVWGWVGGWVGEWVGGSPADTTFLRTRACKPAAARPVNLF